ncbi:hypothetical protein DPMN_105263 [Dreissena polymorpha]|uniref:Uncharacterized protein n=1 Tax=Dreissena polymorpha TaxID=45954 RepID=A0A9D4HEI0_DREPO|nr:hypothetical protein DPMN_105263 [Dreissena polymorpha]
MLRVISRCSVKDARPVKYASSGSGHVNFTLGSVKRERPVKSASKLPHHLTITIFEQSRAIIRTNDLTKFNELLSFKPNKDIIGTHFLNMFHGNQAINVTYNMALDGRKDGRTDRRTTPKQYPSADGGG